MKYLGYFSSLKESNQCLVEYNNAPYVFNNELTFEDVYNKWSINKFKTVGSSAISIYKISFKYCESIHKMLMKNIKTQHMKSILDELKDKYSMKKKILYLMYQLFDYSMKNDLVVKDYSKYLELGEKITKIKRIPFSTEEINKLWLAKDVPWVDSVLILIYTGLRVGELLDLEIKNINLEEKYIRAGSKTKAGINRLVPIHPKILEIIKNKVNENNKYLFVNSKNKKLNYSNYYREKFIPLMKKLNMDHRIHDTRHTFATLLNNSDAKVHQ